MSFSVSRRHRRSKRAPHGADHSCVITCLVPAHNEEDGIVAAVEGLLSQTRRPDRIIVVVDNCDDRTEELVRAMPGVEVFVTVGNTDKKAGALNQACASLLDELGDRDGILVVDADSVLEPGFVAEAHRFLHRPGMGGVGGTFVGGEGGGFVGMLQRNEYVRYARDVNRRNGKVLVLTGTASLFSVDVLRAVVRARALAFPDRPAEVYDTRVLTEDSELTLAILHLGYKVLSPRGCRLTTEVMETWGDLYSQRLRWKRGAVENLVQYGWTNVTRAYWGRQLLSLLGVLVTAIYLASIAVALVGGGGLHLSPFWMGITVLFAAERAMTVRKRGPLMMALSATIVVEMVYDLFLQVVHGRALIAAAIGSERRW